MNHTTELPMYLRRDGLDPAPELGEARESASVQRMVTVFGIPAYVVTRYADVKIALADYERFSNRRPAWPGLLNSPPPPASADRQPEADTAGNLLATDPPDHTRLRRMLSPEFTMRRMNQLEPRVVEIVEQHLDVMEDAGPPADLVAHFALPVPSLVICELLGVPYEDRDGFQRRSARQLDLALPMPERMELALQGRAYMRSLVERARRESGDDIFGTLVRKYGNDVTDAELTGMGALLLLAGHETTSNMLALGTLALLEHPEQLAAVRDTPDAVGPAIEELLRYLSVVQTAIPRMTTTDVEIDGVTIPAGQLVLLSMPVGNRDPRFIESPETLDIRRGEPGHLAFGHGVHHCLGAPLARMEMRIAYPALLRRFPRLRLADDISEIQFKKTHFIYGVRSLGVTW